MQPLQKLIDLLQENRKIRICILDITGILNTPLTSLRRENTIHASTFCNTAKSQEKGGKLCLFCKRLANNKAIIGQKPFAGHCIWGIYEAAHPVIIDGHTAAVVYVGNCISDKDKTMRRTKLCCKSIDFDERELIAAINTCEAITDPLLPACIAEIVADHLKALWEVSPHMKVEQNWLVSGMRRQAQESFTAGITLKDLAALYQKNEKYLGRLFKKESGIAFHEYCNLIRIEHAKKRLASGISTIIDIAFECGYNNVSYFNRTFKKHTGLSPSEFRKVSIKKSKTE